jgi:GAF domain-containing protein
LRHLSNRTTTDNHPGRRELFSVIEGLGAFARTFEAPYDAADVLAEVAERLHGLLQLEAAAAVLTEPHQEPVVRVHPVHRVDLARLAADPTRVPPLVPVLAGEVVRITDLEETGRVRGLAAVPVHAQGQRVGALLLFAHGPREWSPEALAVAEALADMTGAYSAMGRAVRDTSVLADQLQEALHSRVVIEQAKGVLASALGVSVDEAFEQLRRHARSSRTRLDEVAAAVVEKGLWP